MYSSQNLQNATHVNAVVHPLPESEKLLTVFHHFSNYSSFFIQCLKPASFTLNSKMVQCQRLEYFSLPENFEIIFEGKTLKSQKLIEEKHKIKVSWMQDFVFSNIDQKPLSVNPPLTDHVAPYRGKIYFRRGGGDQGEPCQLCWVCHPPPHLYFLWLLLLEICEF